MTRILFLHVMCHVWIVALIDQSALYRFSPELSSLSSWLTPFSFTFVALTEVSLASSATVWEQQVAPERLPLDKIRSLRHPDRQIYPVQVFPHPRYR